MTGTMLAIFLGWAGGYRFYKKQIGLGILYLFTFGLFTIGWIYDIFASISDSKTPELKSTDVPSKRKYSDEYFNFDDHYFEKCEKWYDKIMDMDPRSDNPDKNVKVYNKMIAEAERLKEFCESKPGGSEYYEDNYGTLIPEIQENLDEYLKEDYESDKEDYEYWKARRDLINKTSDQIIKMVANGVVSQVAIKDSLSGDSLSVYDSAVSELIKENKISKSHVNGRIFFSLPQ